MSDPVEDFREEFYQDVLAEADAGGRFFEDAFFEMFCAPLVEAGELDTADRARYSGLRGVRIDGYGGDPLASGTLTLIIVETEQVPAKLTLTATQMSAVFNRARNFLEKSLSDAFRDSLEPTSEAFGLADLIAARWPRIDKVRIILITDKELSSRIDGMAAEELRGVQITHSVWDIGRLYRLVLVGRGREDADIDLEGDFGGAIPALPAHLSDAEYETYLLVVPGEQLAKIYDHWGARLLEQNVRVFLQARGNVNKGIRNTIDNEPEMFLAYNNGITATAEKVTAVPRGSGLAVTNLTNLQIVNGGQTTASIHAALRRKADLSRIFVQMKLSVIPEDRTTDVVPKISLFANSQNKVNAADFFANHPFHIRMETFSRRVYAPSPDGAFKHTKWFYERARGQYQDQRGKLAASQQKTFDAEYPKAQVFTKTDLAKYLMVWRGEPHIVSRGAQKNFAAFATLVGKEWDKNSDAFNEMFYREAIVKAIIFRETERMVQQQDWYAGGYRANIVAYALAKLGSDLRQAGRVLDVDGVWKRQATGPELGVAIVAGAEAVHTVLTDPPSTHNNVTEWAKQQACWDRVQRLTVEWPIGLLRDAPTVVENRAAKKDAVADQRVVNGIEAQTLVFNAGATFWREVLDWGISKKRLSPTQVGILQTCASMPARVPSEKQAVVALDTLAHLQKEGCTLTME